MEEAEELVKTSFWFSQKPAMQWYYHQDQDTKSTTTDGYWDFDWSSLSLPEAKNLEPTKWTMDTGADLSKAVDLQKIWSLSYRQLFHILHVFIEALSKKVLDCMNEERKCELSTSSSSSSESGPELILSQQQFQKQQPVIAICIPEGPFLPIAISAVHIMNGIIDIRVNHDKNSNGGSREESTTINHNYNRSAPLESSKPVILPLDPQEGAERLKFMIEDAKPSIILYVKHTMDGKKMEKIVKDIELLHAKVGEKNVDNDNDHDKRNGQNIFNDQRRKVNMHSPQLIDVKSLLLEEPKKKEVDKSSIISPVALLKKMHQLLNHKAIINYTNRISHIVYTSGTTGNPKGTISSVMSLLNYAKAKNLSHNISPRSNVFLASSISFDPCLSDIIATLFYSNGACLSFCSKEFMKMNLSYMLNVLKVSHVLCTPSLWNSVDKVKRKVQNHNQNDCGCTTTLENLEVVALGGEVMSGRIKGTWARSTTKILPSGQKVFNEGTRLLSTYGVTEACVYQTVGEVFVEDTAGSKKKVGYDVGLPMGGMRGFICKETDCDDDNSNNDQRDGNEKALVFLDHMEIGEIVLSGDQLDEFSGYLNLPKLTKKKFVKLFSDSYQKTEYFYRTGDRGLIDKSSGRLHILGRIGGEEGMMKISGVRVELGEIEHAILDSESFSSNPDSQPLIIGCTVLAQTINDNGDKKLVAYCQLSDNCLKEMGKFDFVNDHEGLLCSQGSLLTLLRARCELNLRRECIPSAFVLIPRIPLTRTGKCNKKALPSLDDCRLTDDDDVSVVRLDNYGRCGKFVFSILVECLNLQLNQHDILTTKANFAMLGGDSLGATLIVRSLYALHYGINNTRTLGGNFGSFEQTPFDVNHLLRSTTLKEYVDFLDTNNILLHEAREMDEKPLSHNTEPVSNVESTNQDLLLYESLFEAIMLGHSVIALALLAVGANPNAGDHGKRLGKLKNGRKEQKQLLKSNPLHLACTKGNSVLVAALLHSGCNSKSPDAGGQYPLHLACSGKSNTEPNDKEDQERLECVRLLLEVGKLPLTMKNGSKQTVLHCAARAGHCHLLLYLLQRWGNNEKIKANKQWGPSKFDWQDRWFRTPVHWAVLNGKVDALRLLLGYCSPSPPVPKNSLQRSSLVIETPFEICERLYNSDSETGEAMKRLLIDAGAQAK